MMPPLMMVKEDYFTGSARSRIIRWHRVHHPRHMSVLYLRTGVRISIL